MIKKIDSAAKKEISELLNSETGVEFKWLDEQVAEVTLSESKKLKQIKDQLKNSPNVTTCHSLYTLEDGLKMGVTDEILLRFLPEVPVGKQNELIKRLKLTKVKETRIYEKYRVKKGADALALANEIYESGLVEYSTPKVYTEGMYHQVIPDDTYFANQITCHNTGQVFNDGHSGTNDADIDAPEAWEVTRGCGDVVIAVLDQGVTSNHPDLPNTRQIRLNGSNFGTGNANDPSPINDENHGNACAGVIAATMDNNEGIAGIAPSCRIMPVRLPEDFDPEDVADAIEFAVDNGADILSNSWGYSSSNNNLHPVIITALTYAINAEVLIFFAAGNTADLASNDNGYVTFPANSNIVQIITVGASDRDDSQANYSPKSSLIDLVAPSHRAYPTQISGENLEMYSIDIPGNDGYNPSGGETLPNTGTNNLSYTGRFGGTSHACPVVAAVAALVLSMDPSLTPEEVFTILRNTADDEGGYSYSNGRCNEMGHGRVNANAAVREVLDQFTITAGPNVVCYSSNPANASQFTASNSPTCSTIDWTTSSNMEVVDGDNTLTPKVNARYASSQGSGWVQINYLLDGETTPGPRKNVYVGKPDPSDIDFINVGPNYPGSMVLCDDMPNDGKVSWGAEGSILNYSWSIYDDGSNYWQVNQHPMEPFPEIPMKDVQFSKPYGSVNGYVNVIVKAENTCGWGVYSAPAMQFTTSSCGGMMLMMSPNPGSGETTVSVVPELSDESTLKSASTEPTFDNETEWELEVYSTMQSLKAKQTKIRGNSTKINTQSWKEGIYTVRAKYKGEILTGKLVVKK